MSGIRDGLVYRHCPVDLGSARPAPTHVHVDVGAVWNHLGIYRNNAGHLEVREALLRSGNVEQNPGPDHVLEIVPIRTFYVINNVLLGLFLFFLSTSLGLMGDRSAYPQAFFLSCLGAFLFYVAMIHIQQVLAALRAARNE